MPNPFCESTTLQNNQTRFRIGVRCLNYELVVEMVDIDGTNVFGKVLGNVLALVLALGQRWTVQCRDWV